MLSEDHSAEGSGLLLGIKNIGRLERLATPRGFLLLLALTKTGFLSGT
jgi:hypothetical protein